MDRALKLVGDISNIFLKKEALALMLTLCPPKHRPNAMSFFWCGHHCIVEIVVQATRGSPFSTRGRRHRRPTKAYH
jgi:hypothetical protein